MKITIPFPVLAVIFMIAGFSAGRMIWVEVVLK
jgi:hypothetical protein